ncbi:MAG: pre-peptidase C-terminal domain-containing protein, partial [Thermoanaerobaculia bacterium]
GDGQTCDIGSHYIALGEPWSGAHQMTQDLVRSWKKIWFDTRHPSGTVPGPGRITYPVPAGHGTHAHVVGTYDGWMSIEPPNQQAADIVNHEYGHVVMSNLWIGFSPYWPTTDCPSPHYISLASGPGCALSEGFANFWAWYSNQFYDGDSSTANDGGTFNWPGGAWTDLESRGEGFYEAGDQVEGNVAAALGDLLDGENEGPASGAGDRVTEGIQHIWHTFYTQSDSNFAQWWNAYWAEQGHEPCAPLAALQHNTMPYTVAQCSGAACYVLTRTHTGMGADPVASPANSPGCPAGQYSAGQSIQLSATPASGSTVESWTGTAADASTSSFNSLVMPAGHHAVAVHYVVQPDIPLSNGVPVDGSLNGSSVWEQWDFYYVDLGSGVQQLGVDLHNLTKDADLLVRYGAKPDPANFDCVSSNAGTAADQCSFSSPAAGRWWIGVVNYAPGLIDYTIEATWSSPPDAGTDFFTLAPCRVFDSRSGSALLSLVPRVIQIAGLCGVPSTAKAVAVNVTAVSPTGLGYLTLWPGGTMPLASVLNYEAGRTRANNAVQALAGDGSGTLSARAFVAGDGQVHLVIDVVGYFE